MQESDIGVWVTGVCCGLKKGVCRVLERNKDFHSVVSLESFFPFNTKYVLYWQCH